MVKLGVYRANLQWSQCVANMKLLTCASLPIRCVDKALARREARKLEPLCRGQKAHLTSLKHMSGVAFTSHHQGQAQWTPFSLKGAACSHWHHAWGSVSKSQRSAFYEKALADHIMLFPYGSQGFCAMLRFVMIEVGAKSPQSIKKFSLVPTGECSNPLSSKGWQSQIAIGRSGPSSREVFWRGAVRLDDCLATLKDLLEAEDAEDAEM